MFKRSETDKRRVIIVDVSHLFYKFQFSRIPPMSATVKVGGQNVTLDTKLPALTIKCLNRWANDGINPLVVCFDSRGCSKSRKMYFTKADGCDTVTSSTGEGYKGNRESQNGNFYDSINLTLNLLLQGGVTCLCNSAYEADDLIKAAVDKAKIQYPDLPIDVITGDADLIPLVDDQVSVFLTSRKTTWAEEKSIEKTHYVQVTPNNYQGYLEDLSAYKNLSLPYNTLLLAKLLRGDKSDDISGYPKFTPTKFRKLIDDLLEDGHDLSDLFRYDSPIETVYYKGTDDIIPQDKLSEVPKECRDYRYQEPPCLTRMCEVLSNYLDEDQINHIRFVYNGINLNGAFTGLGEMFDRRPAKMLADVKGYDIVKLSKEVWEVARINLPIK